MPALPLVPRVLRFDFRQSYGSAARVMDRVFFLYSGAVSSTDLTTLLTTVRNAWNTNIAPVVTTAHTLLSVTGTDLNSAAGAQAVNSVQSVGTIIDPSLPADAAFIIKFKIARRYRGGHPRFYLIGRGTGSIGTTQQWSAGTVTSVITAWQNFIAACTLAPPAAIGTLTHSSVSYFAGFTNRTFPSGRTRAVPSLRASPLVDPVLSYSGNPIFGSQRRRAGQSP